MRMVVFMFMHITCRPYVNLLAWTYVGVHVIASAGMCYFQNLCVILSVYYLINVYRAHKNKQIEYMWVSHETKHIYGPFCPS